MSEREDAFYFVKIDLYSEPFPARWKASLKCWLIAGNENLFDDAAFVQIGPRVQRDSEVVRERDELLAALKLSIKLELQGSFEERLEALTDLNELIARIESQKSRVKP